WAQRVPVARAAEAQSPPVGGPGAQSDAVLRASRHREVVGQVPVGRTGEDAARLVDRASGHHAYHDPPARRAGENRPPKTGGRSAQVTAEGDRCPHLGATAARDLRLGPVQEPAASGELLGLVSRRASKRRTPAGWLHQPTGQSPGAGPVDRTGLATGPMAAGLSTGPSVGRWRGPRCSPPKMRRRRRAPARGGPVAPGNGSDYPAETEADRSGGGARLN